MIRLFKGTLYVIRNLLQLLDLNSSDVFIYERQESINTKLVPFDTCFMMALIS